MALALPLRSCATLASDFTSRSLNLLTFKVGGKQHPLHWAVVRVTGHNVPTPRLPCIQEFSLGIHWALETQRPTKQKQKWLCCGGGSVV